MVSLELFTGILGAAFLGLQAWQLHVLVELKVQVASLKTKIEGLLK